MYCVTQILHLCGAVCMAGRSLGGLHLLLHCSPEQLHWHNVGGKQWPVVWWQAQYHPVRAETTPQSTEGHKCIKQSRFMSSAAHKLRSKLRQHLKNTDRGTNAWSNRDLRQQRLKGIGIWGNLMLFDCLQCKADVKTWQHTCWSICFQLLIESLSCIELYCKDCWSWFTIWKLRRGACFWFAPRCTPQNVTDCVIHG